jgi:molecular chaperone IbpA
MNNTELALLNSTLNNLFIGADRFNDDLLLAFTGHDSKFPPYNQIQIDKDHYVMELALAGYTSEDVSITTENGYITIASTKEHDSEKETKNYVRKGIARRAFSLSFKLYEYVIVTKAEFKNGMLSIYFEHNIPEELKPKTITINTK